MSLPAMFVDETVGEILQGSHFARDMVEAISKKMAVEDLKTPLTQRRNPFRRQDQF